MSAFFRVDEGKYFFMYVLTDKVMILSNNMTGGMWKSNTKYCERKT